VTADGQDKRKRGEELFNEVYGGTVPIPPGAYQDKFFAFTVDHLFAEVWSRNSMSVRDRRLVAIGVMAALGESDTFEIQVRAALGKGELTEAQLEDLLVFLTQYVGFPRTTRMLAAVRKIMNEKSK